MLGTTMSAGLQGSVSKALRLSALPLLAIMLIAATPWSVYAEDPVIAAQPLEAAIKANTTQPARFVLSNGKTVIGRIVKTGSDSLTIRRPSAGLASLALADIVGVNIKTKGGDLMRGRLVPMADGAIGWVADSGAQPGSKRQLAKVDLKELSEAGGPLIPFRDEALEQDEAQIDAIGDVDANAIALNQADAVTPALVNPIQAEPIRLLVTADPTSESDNLMYFRLTLSEPAPKAVLIIYTTINGTAVAPGDYTHRQGVVVFEPGQTQAVVATSVINDEVAEGDESFAFFVTGDPASVTIKERKIAATIEDDDT